MCSCFMVFCFCCVNDWSVAVSWFTSTHREITFPPYLLIEAKICVSLAVIKDTIKSNLVREGFIWLIVC